MGIFDKIKDAIWGSPAQAAEAPQAPATPTPAPAPASPAPSASPAPKTAAPASPAPTAAPTASPAAPAPSAPASGPVDVEAILEAAAKGKKLNWRTSIVDLMKALDLDSSLDARKELATELGYTGDMSKSAEMNMWLHKAVIQKLKDNGGKVPADLL